MNYVNQNIKINVRKFLNEYYEKKTKENDFNIFMDDLLSKYDYEDIYLSFRDRISTTMINKNNKYNTPTGIYTYKLSDYYDNNRKFIINDFYGDRLTFPFASTYPFLYFYVVKNDVNILSQDTDEEIFDDYVLKIKKLFNNNEEIKNKCDKWFERFKSNDIRDNFTCGDFWRFLYLDILGGEKSEEHDGPIGNTNIRFTNLCNKLGIDGFTDKGSGYIHPNEKKQTVFFKPNLFKDIKIYKVKNSWELERKMDSLPGSDEEIKLSNNINDIKKILLKYNNNNRSLYVNIVRHFSHKGKRELEFYNNVLKDKEFGYQFVEPIVQNMKNSKYPDKIIDIIVKNGYQNHDKFVEYIYSLPIDNPLFEYILFSQPQIRMNVSKTIKFFIKNKLDLDFFYTYFDPKNYRLPVYDIINLIDYANDDKKMFTFLLPTIKNLRDKSDIINVALSLKDINLRNFLINTEIKNK